MIKAILFDYGGVITDGGRGGISDTLGAALGLSNDEAWELLSIVWNPYMKGELTLNEVWVELEKAYGRSIPAEKRGIWNDWDKMQPFPEMIRLVEQLKASGKTVGLLSNVFPVTMQGIKTNGGYDSFDFTVLSCEVGCVKPEPEIYELALQKLPGAQPNEVIFVDDQERCLAPARDMGVHTVLAETPQQVSDDLYALIEQNL